MIEATWGWFIMLYEYGTHLIEGKLGCKWYISMVTGWNCHSPKFSQYYDEWLRKYIIVPSYHEKIGYIDKYTTTKNKWFTIPKMKYFDTPKDELKTDLSYTKKIVVDRSGETFVEKLGSFYKTLYIEPRDTIYKWMLSDSKAKEIKTGKSNDTIFTWIKYIILILICSVAIYFYKDIIGFFTPYISKLPKIPLPVASNTI